MYKIEVETQFEESWRYNLVVMCGGYTASAKQLYVVSTEDTIAEIEDFQTTKPDGYTLPRQLSLKAKRADNIRALVYVIPHTPPANRDIEEFAPFEMSIKIARDGKEIYSQIHDINQWSGSSIEIKL
ncbi:MAG: hypothetical protein SNH01_04195 [Rikenellaceae bacterium]